MKNYFYSLMLCLSPLMTSGQAVITAVFDADLPGGLPKGTEVYITQDITDLSLLGIGSANNGGGTNGVEFAFPAIATDSGTYVYIASDSASFADFFGFNADYISIAMAINGDDAIELFWDSTTVIDVFGEISVDGTGQPWEYTDGWAARKPLTGPDGSTFVLQNWNFSGVGGLDMEVTNDSAQNPIPLQSYTDTAMMGPDVIVILQNLLFTPKDVTIEVGQTVRWTNVEDTEEHNVNGQQSVYPCNPVGFFSGLATVGPWDFDVTFNVPGVYDYQCDPHVSFGMVGTVTVIDPEAPAFPAYDIGIVTTEDAGGNADSSGTLCEISGVVHGPNFRPSGLQFTIIDVASGVGINVFKSAFDCYQVTEGDLISIKGEITQFNGLTEIVPSDRIEVISSGNPLMPPTEVNAALDESFESTMVILQNLVVDSIVSTGSSGWNLFATGNGSTQYLIRLDADVFTDVSIYEEKSIHVTGIVGQFDSDEPYTDGYQLQPRSPEDIDIISSVHTLPESAIRISPNPAQAFVYLETEHVISEILIYNTDGQIVLVETFTNSLVNISGLPAGAYVIVADTPDGQWSGKFIKH